MASEQELQALQAANRPPELLEPRIVSLLRAPYLAALATIAARLRESFPDLRPAQLIVFQMIVHYAAGCRLTELAARAHLSKPAMLELVDGLERGGYVERIPDPSDRRAKLIRLTDRGWDAYALGFQVVSELQEEWADRLGADKFGQMFTLLRELNTALGLSDAADTDSSDHPGPE
jgi:DNA-binding MarR family transcriptional regulator